MRGFAIAAAAAAALLAPATMTAQRLTPAFAAVPEPWAEERSERMTVAVFGHPDDYRWEGALVGGVGGGVTLSVIGIAFCGFDQPSSADCVVKNGLLGLVIGATIGAGAGALVGGLIPKH